MRALPPIYVVTKGRRVVKASVQLSKRYKGGMTVHLQYRDGPVRRIYLGTRPKGAR